MDVIYTYILCYDSLLQQFRENQYNNSTIKSIQYKIKSNNLVLTKADKGNIILIINSDEYNSKEPDFISTKKLMHCTEILINDLISMSNVKKFS